MGATSACPCKGLPTNKRRPKSVSWSCPRCGRYWIWHDGFHCWAAQPKNLSERIDRFFVSLEGI